MPTPHFYRKYAQPFSEGSFLKTPLTVCVGSMFQANAFETRSSWLNCALRDDEAVYWVSIGHYEAVAVGN